MMAIIKFEKLFKSLFGIGDSMIGDLKTSGAKLFMGMNAAKGLYDTTAAPFKKHAEAKRRVDKYGGMLGLTTDKQKEGYARSKSNKSTSEGDQPNQGSTNNGVDPRFTSQAQEMVNNAMNNSGNGNSNGGNTSSGGGSGNKYSSEMERAIIEDRQERVKERKQKLIDEYNDAQRDMRASKRDRWLNAAGGLASMSIGLGAADEWHESAKIAELISKPISSANTRMVEKQENMDAHEATKNEKGWSKYQEKSFSEAIKDGIKGITIENIVDKSRDSDGKVIPVKLAIEYAKLPYTNSKNALRSSGRREATENR
jgi:hypothetical protein